MNPNPNCELDCRFQMGSSATTCAYFQPIYDKNGKNINPDKNTTTTTIYCSVCNTGWIAKTQLGQTKYEVIK